MDAPKRWNGGRGPEALNWRGGRHVGTNGYVRIWDRDRIYRYEHRVVAEQMLGRPLTSREQVHHKNGDKTDNRPENLLVLGIREHALLHEEHHFGPILRWAAEYDACIDCGTTDRRHDGGGRCARCHHRHARANGATW